MDDAAQEILNEVKIANVATIMPDGAPRATPVHFATDGIFLYWISDRESVHSRNIAQDARVSVSVWRYTEGTAPTGLYLQTNAEMLSGEEAEHARAVYLEKFGGIPPHFADHDFYRAAIGSLDEASTRPLRWYFTAK